MKKGLVSSCLSFLVAAAAAQGQSAYGQCGGSGYSGSTSCTSGYTCASQNPYYYQCVPGTASATATSTTAPATTTTTSSSATKTTSTTSSPAASPTSGTSTFAKTDGLLFNIDGVTEYYAGTNCYWCGFLTSDEDVDAVFSHMAAAGLKIVRVWGFNDVNTVPSAGTVWYQALSSSGSQINTGADGLERLDAVVAAAETHGIKLIVNFVNNWSDCPSPFPNVD